MYIYREKNHNIVVLYGYEINFNKKKMANKKNHIIIITDIASGRLGKGSVCAPAKSHCWSDYGLRSSKASRSSQQSAVHSGAGQSGRNSPETRAVTATADAVRVRSRRDPGQSTNRNQTQCRSAGGRWNSGGHHGTIQHGRTVAEIASNPSGPIDASTRFLCRTEQILDGIFK